MPYTFNPDDAYALSTRQGAETREKGKELFYKLCPYCLGGDSGDKETFSINLETGAFKCFRASCGKQGHFVEMARDFDYPLNFGDEKKRYRKLRQKPLVVRDKALEFLVSRGISADIGRTYKVTTQAGKDNIIVFPFYDENGMLVSAKYRKADFVKGKDKNKEWFEHDTKPILFGMMQCSDFDTLVITEGQLDSLSVAEAGVKNAVSVPNGAQGMTWATTCYDWVNKFKELVIFGDCEHGHITLVDAISARFPMKKIRVVRMADYLGEKDANDILRKYGKEAVKKCVENAEVKPVAAVKRLSDAKYVDMLELPHIETGVSELDAVIGGLYFGTVTLLTGETGEGKSTFASWMIANALGQGYGVFVYSGELPDYNVKAWLDMQLAGDALVSSKVNKFGVTKYYTDKKISDITSVWYYDKIFVYDNTVNLEELETVSNRETLLSTVEQAVCRYGLKLVLIDNLMMAMDVNDNTELYRAQSNFVRALELMAKRLDIAIILVAHPKKESGEIGKNSISGSKDITNLVDVVLTYSPNSGDDKDQFQSLIGCVKFRGEGAKLTGNGRIKVHYSPISKRITCASDDPHKVFECFEKVRKSKKADTAEPTPF